MAQLYVSATPGQQPNEANVYERSDAGTLFHPVQQDPQVLKRRTVCLDYRGSIYLVGTFSRMKVRDKFGAYHPAGLLPPRTKPVLADGGIGSAGDHSVGNMIGYQTFVMKAGDLKIVESNPGPASDTLAAVGTGRAWSNLDWSPADAHATHARGYVSVDGSFPALAWEVPLMSGSATLKEAVSTAGLGTVLPVRKALDQSWNVDLYARGIPPYCQFAEVYHEAFFYAGDPLHPERIYYSLLYEPEAVNSTPIRLADGRIDKPWLETRDGQPVTGLQRQGDELIVGKPHGLDSIQGYAYADLAIRTISEYWGVTSHFSMRRCGPQDALYFSAPQGPTIYNAGSFFFIGEKVQTWWRDNIRANPTPFENAFGIQDRFWESYKLLLPGLGPTNAQGRPGALWLVVDFHSVERGAPIWHGFDERGREDWIAAEMRVDGSGRYRELYTGSHQYDDQGAIQGSSVHQENVEDDADDAGDSYAKAWTIDTPHRYMGDQGGDEAHGYAFHPLDLYMQHANNAATISLYGGDDHSPDQAVSPHWTTSSAATEVATGKRKRAAKTSEHHAVSGTSGKGVTLRVTVSAPLSVEYRGWGIGYREGPAGEQPFRE